MSKLFLFCMIYFPFFWLFLPKGMDSVTIKNLGSNPIKVGSSRILQIINRRLQREK
jgi:hypothetical protein